MFQKMESYPKYKDSLLLVGIKLRQWFSNAYHKLYGIWWIENQKKKLIFHSVGQNKVFPTLDSEKDKVSSGIFGVIKVRN